MNQALEGPSPGNRLGVVVIGRNEGMRLARCLASVRSVPVRVYVDSGSTDGSVELARGEGVTVVELPIPPHFTAARARNAGLTQLLAMKPEIEFVQMVDGDSELQPDWIEAALAALRADPDLAVVFGRLRERHPERSIFNKLCDEEWNVPIGEASGCGGNAMFRVSALREVKFYNPAVMAGEEFELALRLRRCGWRLRRIDAEMALHDAAMTRLSQWWGRSRRSGHGYAQLALLHPDATDPDWPRAVLSIVLWGGVIPATSIGALTITAAAAVGGSPHWWVATAIIFLLWPVRMAQLTLRQWQRGLSAKLACASAGLLMLVKVPQLVGLIGYHRDRLAGRTSRLIEYKGTQT